MAITFDQISSTNRVPGTYAEVDGSRALAQQPGQVHRALLVALKLAAGSAAADQVIEVTGELSGDALFGTGSQAAEMARAFKRINPSARLFALPVLEAGGGTAAVSTLTLSGTSTLEGPLTVRLGDRRTTVNVPVGSAAAAAAALLNTALGLDARAAVTSSVTDGVITLTARHKGEGGNAVSFEAEQLPAGLTAAVAQTTPGATNPSIATALANLDDSRYDTVASSFADAANVTALRQEFERRWTPGVKQPGHAFVSMRGTHGATVAAGNALNSEHLTLFGAGLSPTPPWIWAAEVAARDAQQTDLQPNRPRTGLSLNVEAPKPADRFDAQERNALLFDGVSTYTVAQDGKVLIERLITTYQTNAAGSADATYLEVATMRSVAAYYQAIIALGDRHQRDLIAPDGTTVDPGVPVLTPKMLRGELIADYRQRERAGLVKEADQYAAELVVELTDTDVHRMNAHVSPRFVNGLQTLAFKLSIQL